MVDPYKAVKWMRDKYPSTAYMSDDMVYRMAKNRFPQYEYQQESPFLPDIAKENIIPNQEKNVKEYKHSPGAVGGLLNQLDLAEQYAKKGMPWLGLRPEAFQSAANENISGMIHSLATGDLKYNVDDYDPTFKEEIAQFFIGIANPLDAVAFFGSSAVGAAIGKPLLKSALNKKFF